MDFFYKKISPPLTTCSVTIKQVDTENVGSDGKDVFNYLFPVFLDPRVDEYSPYKSNLHRIMRRRMATMNIMGNDKFKTERYKRYQGRIPLGVGRYYSVCNDKYGNDNGTLCSELLAYHDPYVAGVIEIYDTCVQLHRKKLKNTGIPIDLNQSIVFILRNHSIGKYTPEV